MGKIKLLLIITSVAVAVSGCAELEPLAEYTPVVDPGRTNAARFERDLPKCRNIALKLEADYRQRQQEELGANLLAGLLVGALTGAVVGHNSGNQGDYVRAGIAAGALSGAASGDYTGDLVKYGPRRVVDRCMSDRGHVILNDIGRG